MTDHLDRLQRALDYVERNLDGPVSLGEAAREACMSAFHFSRTFHATVGEPLFDYVRGRRLTRGAALLLESDRSVLDVALSSGFDSQEAFTRAFSRQYRLPPARFRRRGRPVMLRDIPPLNRLGLEALAAGDVTLQPRIVERPGSVYVGIACANTASSNRIPQAWGAFLPRMAELPSPTDGSTYGIYRYDFTADEADIGGDFPFEYMAAGETSSAAPAALPHDMTAWQVPGGRYAVFEHRGLLRDLGNTYRYVHKTWIARAPFRLEEAPFFERHRPDYPGDRREAVTEIWIPIRAS